MKKTNKRAFTIVELVIVIAVIAVLAAVLIPTFSGVVKKAKISADTQLAKNMNTALAMAKANQQEPEDMTEVLTIINDAGYIIENLNPTTEGYYFAWDQELNQILFLDNNLNLHYPDNVTLNKANCWITTGSATESVRLGNAGYNLYLEKDISADITLTTWVGVDTGVYAMSGDLSISGSAASTIVLRGQFDDVTVNNGSGSVDNSGFIGNLTITAIAPACFNNYGSINEASVAQGTLVNKATIATISTNDGTIKNEGAIETVSASAGTIENKGAITTITASTGTVKNEGNINNISAETGTITNTGYIAAATGAAASTAKTAAGAKETAIETNLVIEVTAATQLQNLAYSVNNGADYSKMTIKLMNDIDLTGRTWVPFGFKSERMFAGTIDGNNKKIIGMSDVGYVGGETFTNSSTKTSGVAYGLITYATDATIKNLSMVDVNITSDKGNKVAGLIGEIYGTTSILNCSVSGNIHGLDKVAGFVGQLDNSSEVLISDCTNNANIYSYNNDTTKGSCRAGGFVAQASGANNPARATFINCTNNGNVTAQGVALFGTPARFKNNLTDYYAGADWPVVAGGLIGVDNSQVTVVTNFTNSGTLSATSLRSGVFETKDGKTNYYYGGQTGKYIARQNVYMTIITIDNVTYSNSGLITQAFNSLDPNLASVTLTADQQAWIALNNPTLSVENYLD